MRTRSSPTCGLARRRTGLQQLNLTGDSRPSAGIGGACHPPLPMTISVRVVALLCNLLTMNFHSFSGYEYLLRPPTQVLGTSVDLDGNMDSSNASRKGMSPFPICHFQGPASLQCVRVGRYMCSCPSGVLSVYLNLI